MISVLTPAGAKNLILRGWKGPNGLKGFAQVRVTTPDGDKQVWDGTLAALSVFIEPPFVQGLGASASAVTICAPSGRQGLRQTMTVLPFWTSGTSETSYRWPRKLICSWPSTRRDSGALVASSRSQSAARGARRMNSPDSQQPSTACSNSATLSRWSSRAWKNWDVHWS